MSRGVLAITDTVATGGRVFLLSVGFTPEGRHSWLRVKPADVEPIPTGEAWAELEHQILLQARRMEILHGPMVRLAHAARQAREAREG